LEYALEWKADIDVVREAVKQRGEALQFAQANLQADRNLVISAVQHSGRALQHASPVLQADREVVMMAVGQSGDSLEFADVSLKADKEIVTAAVIHSGIALKFAAWSFRADRDMVVMALHHSAWALEYASPELQADQEIRIIAVGLALDRFRGNRGQDHENKEAFAKDRDMVIRGIVQNGLQSLQLGPTLRRDLLKDASIALALVQHEPDAYKYLQAPMRANLEIARVALESDWKLMSEVPYALRTNLELQVAAVSQDKGALKFLLPTDRKRVSDIVDRSRVRLQRSVSLP
jgi:hypothetical protein